LQPFFAFDGDTKQPMCFTIGTPSRTVTPATPELLQRAAQTSYHAVKEKGCTLP
jgi:hypothetical protein